MTRLTKAMSKEEIMAKVMARVATMNKVELGNLYDELFGDVVEEPKVQVEEPKKKAPKKAECTLPRISIKDKSAGKITQEEWRALYEAHARFLKLWNEEESKVDSKAKRQKVYAAMYVDYKPKAK